MLNTCKVLVKHGCKDICINVCLCVCGFMYIQNVHTYCPVRYTYNKQFLMQLHAPEAATINTQQIPFQHKKNNSQPSLSRGKEPKKKCTRQERN